MVRVGRPQGEGKGHPRMREGDQERLAQNINVKTALGLSSVIFPTAVWLDLIVLILQIRELGIKEGM